MEPVGVLSVCRKLNVLGGSKRQEHLRQRGMNEAACGGGRYAWAPLKRTFFLNATAVAYASS